MIPNHEAPAALSDASDHSLLRQYRHGDQDAALEIYLRYAKRLRALARAQLSTELASRVDADDIVQSVFGSFFRGVNAAFYDVPMGEELWKLLLVIALHKIRNQGDYHQAAKRDVRRTVPSEEAAQTEDNRAAEAFLKLVVDETLAQLPASHKEMVEMRMEGFSVLEIAAKTGRAKRSVERLLQQARTKLDHLIGKEH